MSIPDIRPVHINIRDVNINPVPRWAVEPSIAVPIYPPVTSQVGIPIINVPGCVESHEDSNKNANLPNNDPDQVKIFCDGEMPSFNAINYDARRLQYETEQKSQEVPPIKSPEEPEAPEPPTPKTPVAPKTPDQGVDCPTEAQGLKEPVGFIKGDQKVVEYRLVGKECIQVTEDIGITEQIVGNIPSAGAVTATASIAVVATSSAILAKPLADLLLRVVKPVVKKALTKVQTLLGKKPRRLSRQEVLANQYREKRGLPVLKEPKKKG